MSQNIQMNDTQLLILGAVAFKKTSKEFLFSDRSDVGGIFLWNAYYYNVSLSFELSLKCFLAYSKFSQRQLKDIGHDLIECFNQAVHYGFRPHNERVLDTLKILSPVYKSHELRYLKNNCLLYTSPSPRDRTRSRMPSSA